MKNAKIKDRKTNKRDVLLPNTPEGWDREMREKAMLSRKAGDLKGLIPVRIDKRTIVFVRAKE